jgi:hypothetical protein
VTLAGGDAHALTLKDLLDAAEAIFVDEYRIHSDLLSALEEMSPWAQGGGEVTEGEVSPAQNADALSALESMMKEMR